MKSTDSAFILRSSAALLVVAMSCLATTAAHAQLCQPDEFSCLATREFDARGGGNVQCNATGNGGVLLNTCDSFNEFCFEGINFCGTGPLMCSPGAIRGCYANTNFLQCNLFGNGLDQVACPAGDVCVNTGQCIARPFSLLEPDPAPNVVSVGDIAVTEVAGSTTAITAYADGFAATNDLQLRVLDPNATSYIVPSGVFGTGRNPRTSAARNVARDGVLTAWYKTTGTFPNDVDQIYYRWLNPDGSGSTSETLIGEGSGPDVVALGALTGAVVWHDGDPTMGQLWEVKGWILCPGCFGGFPISIATTGLSAGRPQAAPHGTGFIVAWTDDNTSVYAQCFNSSGTPALASPLIIASGGGQQFAQVVAGAPGKGAVVVWEDTALDAFRAQRVDTGCALDGSVIEVSTPLPGTPRKDIAMWPSGRFVIAFEESAADPFGILRNSIFTKQYAADGTLEEVANVAPLGFRADDGLGVAAWGTDSTIVVWVKDRDVGSMAKQPCASDITWANQTISEERTRNATNTATLGEDLILDSANISVNAPSISFIGPITIGGEFAAGNAGDCPPPGACVDCLPPVINTFDTDDGGWVSFQNGGTPVSHLVAGGNPGGYIRIGDVTTGWGYLQAPASYLVPDAYGGELSFDLLAVTSNSINFPFIYNVRVGLQGAGLTLINEAGLPAHPPSWMRYEFPLLETSGWRIFSDLSQNYSDTAPAPTQAQMMAVMADLSGVYISADHTDGHLDGGQFDETAIDNVTLSFFP